MNRSVELKRKRSARVRAKLHGTASQPRLSVFRSNRALHAQLIDDNAMRTVVSGSTRGLTKDSKTKINKVGAAEMLGKHIAESALKAGIKQAVMDRGSYRYHGRVKALAEAARKNGLKI